MTEVIYSYMQDVLYCPICANTLRNRNFNKSIYRSCNKGIAHFLSIKIFNKEVERISLILDDYTSLTVDFKENISTYYYDPLKPMSRINIPKVIEPDFPKLEKLKEKLSVYVLFT